MPPNTPNQPDPPWQTPTRSYSPFGPAVPAEVAAPLREPTAEYPEAAGPLPNWRRRGVIIGIGLVVLCVIAAAVGANAGASAGSHRDTGSQPAAAVAVPLPSTSAPVTPTPTGTPAPAGVKPTVRASKKPTKAPTHSASPSPSPSRPLSLCGAPANPWDFNLCGRGSPIQAADLPSGVCRYFHCIGQFTDGRGYMIECKDHTYSMSGGLSYACMTHGGFEAKVTKG